MRHPKVIAWEENLKRVFDQIDHALEDKYGQQYQLHPSRPVRGATSNPEADGLFNVGASFTPGYGSASGRGYVVEVLMITLEFVPPEVQEQMENEVADMLRQSLPQYFPGRDLSVDRDGHVFKITGDLSV